MNTRYDIIWLKQQIEKEIPLKYIYFWGHTNSTGEEVGKFMFSQWFESPFTVEGQIYKTAEHWMMAQKALLFDDKEIFAKIILCRKPAEAKELGRQVKGYEDKRWNEHKFEIVKQGNIHKFGQNNAMKEYLLKTDNRVLVEASPVDMIWGIGLSQDSKEINNVEAWRGENLLGFALMEARDFLKK